MHTCSTCQSALCILCCSIHCQRSCFSKLDCFGVCFPQGLVLSPLCSARVVQYPEFEAEAHVLLKKAANWHDMI